MNKTKEEEYRELMTHSLVTIRELKQKLSEMQSADTEPIAIIGMGCHFPGNCNHPEEFWRFLKSGTDGIREIPSDRWDVDAYYSPVHGQTGKMYIRQGYFLDADVSEFDAKFFKIPPVEANGLDPQQRQLLEVCVETLEDAGLDIAGLRGSKTGVFIGISSNCEYSKITQDEAKFNPYMATGTNSCIASGRICYQFGFQGPAISFDTACSSSMVSTYSAMQSLRRREVDMALSGGVNLMLSPLVINALCAMNALSEDGRCKPFDANGNGYGRGEGCGMIALKRLSDAQRDGDRIYAVLYGGAMNNDGESSGLTVPNGMAQEMVLQASLDSCGVKAEDITYLESHGTGTALGDPLEIGAIKNVYFKNGMRSADNPLYLGAVKGNIGHLESASGIAGIIKTALCIYHGEIPMMMNMNTLNPRLDIADLPLVMPKENLAWHGRNADGKRMAAISSFGFSGTNVNLILGQAPELPPHQDAAEDGYVLKLTAKDEKALVQLIKSMNAFLKEHPDADIGDICYTSCIGRSDYGNRAAIIGRTRTEIADGLQALYAAYLSTGTLYHDDVLLLGSSEGLDRMNAKRTMMNTVTENVYCARIDEMIQQKIALLFPASVEPMRAEMEHLLQTVPDMKQFYQESMEAFAKNAAMEGLGSKVQQDMRDFCAEYALGRYLEQCGAVPEVVYGRGVGAYAAAVLAGYLTLDAGTAYLLDAACGTKKISVPQKQHFGKPKYRYISNFSNAVLRKAEEVAGELLRQPQAQTMSFAKTVQYIYQQGYRLFAVIGDSINDIVVEKDMTVQYLNGTQPFSKTLMQLFGKIYCSGGKIDWRLVYQGMPYQKTVLPTYPFQRSSYWLALPQEEDGLLLYHSTNGLKGTRLQLPIPQQQFLYVFTYQNFPELADNSGVLHIGYYMELLESAAEQILDGEECTVTDMKLLMPVMVFEQEKKELLLMLTPQEGQTWEYKFFSKNHDEEKWAMNVKGHLLQGNTAPDTAEIQLPAADEYDKEAFYDSMVKEHGFYFGPSVRWVERIAIAKNQKEAVAAFRSRTETELRRQYFLGFHPGILDCCAQCINFMAFQMHDSQTKYMVSELSDVYCSPCYADDELYCKIVLQDGEEWSASLELCDADGTVFVRIGNMKVKPFDEEKLLMLRDGLQGDMTGDGKDKNFLTQYMQASGEERLDMLTEYIRQVMAKALEMEPEELDPYGALDDVGLDSMAGLRFMSDLVRRLDIDLVFSDFYNCNSIHDSAYMIRNVLSGESLTLSSLQVAKKDYHDDLSVEKWIYHYQDDKDAKCRIFCFPNGYNSADMFEGWKEILGSSVSVCGIQIPGMDNCRLDEQTPEDIDEFCALLEQVLEQNHLLDKPCAFFGHSWGALFAYRAASRMAQNPQANVMRLFVSGFTSPIEKNSSLVRILEELQKRGIDSLPTYEELKQNAFSYDMVVQAFGKAWNYEEDLTKMTLHLLLSAVRLIDRYVYHADEPFSVPIVGFHGVDDYLVAIEEMQEWEAVTSSDFRLYTMAGDHQFVNQNQSESALLAHIGRELDEALSQ